MKKTLGNIKKKLEGIDKKKILKIVAVGTLLIAITVTGIIVLGDTTLMDTVMSMFGKEVIVEGANFDIINNTKDIVVEGAKFDIIPKIKDVVVEGAKFR